MPQCKIIALLFLFLSLPFSLQAREPEPAEAVLKKGATPEEIGQAIADEADWRDLGYGDFTADMEMVLKNAEGEESVRKVTNRTFERQDTSVGDMSMITFHEPRDVAGTALLTHANIIESDDQWIFLPALKRVKRIASNNKSGSFVGSEFAYEDLASQELMKYSYKYLRNEKCDVADAETQKRECFLLERFPRYENSGYTKQVVWVDTTDFLVRKVDYYDRKESLLKTLNFIDYKQYLDKYWRANLMKMHNHQTGKSTDLNWKEYRFRSGLQEGDFAKDKLSQAR